MKMMISLKLCRMLTLGKTASRCKTIVPDVNDYEYDDLSEVEEVPDHSIVPIVEISGRILTHNIDK